MRGSKHKYDCRWVKVRAVWFFKVYYKGDNPDIPKGVPIVERSYGHSYIYLIIGGICAATVILLPLYLCCWIAHMRHVENAKEAAIDNVLKEFNVAIDQIIARNQSERMSVVDAISVNDLDANQFACSSPEFAQMNYDIETKISQLRGDANNSSSESTPLLKNQRTSVSLPRNMEQLEKLSIKQYNNGNLDGCLAAAQRIIEKDPGSFVGWRMKGMVFFMMGLLENAEKFLQRAISLNAQDVTAQLVYAQYCDFVGKNILADHAFTQGAGHEEAAMNKGFSALFRKQVTVASGYFKALQQERQDPHGYANLGLSVCELYDDNQSNAEQYYKLFLQKPQQLPIRYIKGLRLRALALANLGFWSESIATLETLLKRYPRYQWVQAALPVIKFLKTQKLSAFEAQLSDHEIEQDQQQPTKLSENPAGHFHHPTSDQKHQNTEVNKNTVTHSLTQGQNNR